MKFFLALLFSLFALFGVAPAYAAPYKVAYTAEYFPKTEKDLTVKLSINLTNLRSDIYIREFSMTFPPHFSIESPTSTIGDQSIQTKVDPKKDGTVVTFSLPEDSASKGNETTLNLEFTQKNGIRHVGSIWEILLPAITNKDNSTFTAILHVPPGVDRHVGIVKPTPTEVSGEIIRWENVTAKVVYITFGTSQRYQTNLTYTLKNPELLTKNTSIALPPQTSFQKVYEGAIQPPPLRTFIDSDGNYIAEYQLHAKQELEVKYSAIVEVFARPQESMNSFISKSFTEQKPYILDKKSYWKLEPGIVLPEDSTSQSVKSIFDRVINHLSYDTTQIRSEGNRKGASLAIQKPNQAVCTEYTDLFVALARKAGQPAREIEGYAYSDDANLRPRSFSGDILHSWPEYYDAGRELWIPVDPTWTDTSSIDYFNSFDLNHITLAIHGKDPVYPLPAGMYKLRDGQDIDIKPIATIPKEKTDLKAIFDIPKYINPLSTHKAGVEVENDSNVFLVNAKFKLSSNTLILKPTILTVPLMAPHEKRTILFDFTVSKNASKNRKATLSISYENKKVASKTISIRSAGESVINYTLGIGVAAVFLTTTFYFVKNRKRL